MSRTCTTAAIRYLDRTQKGDSVYFVFVPVDSGTHLDAALINVLEVRNYRKWGVFFCCCWPLDL